MSNLQKAQSGSTDTLMAGLEHIVGQSRFLKGKTDEELEAELAELEKQAAAEQLASQRTLDYSLQHDAQPREWPWASPARLASDPTVLDTDKSFESTLPAIPTPVRTSRAQPPSILVHSQSKDLEDGLDDLEAIMDDWQSGPKSKKRQQLQQIFQMCGFDPATFIEEVEVIRSELEESEVTVEGENISKDDMLNEWGWSEPRVSAVIKFCRTCPAKYMRRDKYEAKTLYWAEKTIKGVHRKKTSTQMNRTARWRELGIKGNLSPAGVVELAPQGGHGAAGKDASVPKGASDDEVEPDADLEVDNLAEIRKQAGLPDIPPDGLPSASAQKMMTCIDKRVITNLETKQKTIEETFNNGVVDGLSRKVESTLRGLFTEAQRSAMEAVSLEGRMRTLYPKAFKKYLKLLFVFVPILGLSLAIATYVTAKYVGGETIMQVKFHFLRQYQLGYVFLAAWLIGLARAAESLPCFLVNTLLASSVFGPVTLLPLLLYCYGRLSFTVKYKKSLKERGAGFLPSMIGEKWIEGLVLLSAIKSLTGHEPLICAVCLEEIMDSETRSRAGPTTGCVHRFHWDCIRKWFQVKAACPVCNKSLLEEGIYEDDPISGKIRPEGVRGSLHSAAAAGHVAGIQRLLAAGASVNRTTLGGVAPLHMAAHHGHAEAIARLLAAGAEVNQLAPGGTTALYIAAQGQHADAVARLLAGGAAVNLASEGGGTALHVAAQNGHTEAVAWLLAGSAEVDAVMDGDITPLFLAAQSGHIDVMVRLLAQGASVTAAAGNGATALHYAALHGHAESVARLLVARANANEATRSGGTALHVAAQGGHTEAVAWLLAGRADVRKEMMGGSTPLYMASMGGHSEVIAWLLAKQAPVETTSRASEANAALYAAVRGGHAEAVSRLLTGGANPNRHVGPSPLRTAVLHGHTEVIGRLLTGGATVKPDDVWAALLLGNLRGARRLAKASNYSWAVVAVWSMDEVDIPYGVVEVGDARLAQNLSMASGNGEPRFSTGGFELLDPSGAGARLLELQEPGSVLFRLRGSSTSPIAASALLRVFLRPLTSWAFRHKCDRCWLIGLGWGGRG
eukprot:g10560.t1